MNQTEYFRLTCYKPVYNLGDRVRGKYNGVPFAGTIGNDSFKSMDEGPYLSIHLDLPLPTGQRIIFGPHSMVTDFYDADGRRFPPLTPNQPPTY
jgi:hypothetical protein